MAPSGRPSNSPGFFCCPRPHTHTFPPPPSPHQDCKSPDVKLGDDGAGHGTVAFRGDGEGADPSPHAYSLDLTLHGAIDAAESKTARTDRHVVLILAKKEAERWPRLLAGGGKAPPYVKVDWDRWMDSDDEDAAAAGPGGGGFDFGDLSQFGNFEAAMQGLGGGGGAPGLDEFVGGDDEEAGDSDDDVEEIKPE
jgi:hypothetical protein